MLKLICQPVWLVKQLLYSNKTPYLKIYPKLDNVSYTIILNIDIHTTKALIHSIIDNNVTSLLSTRFACDVTIDDIPASARCHIFDRILSVLIKLNVLHF